MIMVRTSTRAAMIVCLLLGSAGSWAGAPSPEIVEGVALPSVPTSVDPRRGGGVGPTVEVAQSGGAETMPVSGSAISVTAQPGVNQLVEVAIGHMNRITLPFENPDVWTASGESVEVRQNALYLAPSSPEPISMFITPPGDEGVALSVTLVPQQIPPVEVALSLPTGVQVVSHGNRGDAERWETSHPYVETLRQVVIALASGEVPQGYAAMAMRASGAAPPRCRPGAGFAVDFGSGQYFAGGRLEVFVGLVRNSGSGPAEFREAWCGDHGVAAVALWPQVVLQSREVAEIIVLRHRSQRQPGTPRRSLLQAVGTGAGS